MSKVSSVVTGGVTITAASIEPTVSWALHGFAGAPPSNTALILSALLVTLIHALYNRLTKESIPDANSEKPSGP